MEQQSREKLVHMAERAVQVEYVQEAQAQHYALARAGHSLKQQLNNGLKETTRLQQNERDWQLEMERAMIDMWHCPLHILMDQSPEHCICCEDNQGNINRLKRLISSNTNSMEQLRLGQAQILKRMQEMDMATWGARLEAERAAGQLDYWVTSAGEYKETHCDDSPYSTDRFDDEEGEKQGDVPPDYESPEAEFEDPRFF